MQSEPELKRPDVADRGLHEFELSELTATFTNANQDYAFPINIGRLPRGYVITGRTAAASITHSLDGKSKWSGTQIVLRSDTAGVTANILLL